MPYKPTTMLGLRTTIVLSVVLALLVNTAIAGGDKGPSCDKCQSKVSDCVVVRVTNMLQS